MRWVISLEVEPWCCGGKLSGGFGRTVGMFVCFAGLACHKLAPISIRRARLC